MKIQVVDNDIWLMYSIQPDTENPKRFGIDQLKKTGQFYAVTTADFNLSDIRSFFPAMEVGDYDDKMGDYEITLNDFDLAFLKLAAKS